MTMLGRTNLVFAVFLAIALFFLWMTAALLASLACGLPREDVIAAMFCVATKTPALGLPLLSTVFAGLDDMSAAEMTVPMVLFQCVQTCLCSLATIPLRRWRVPRASKEDLDLGTPEMGTEDSGSAVGRVSVAESAEGRVEKDVTGRAAARTPARTHSGGFDNPVEHVGL